MSKKIIKRVVAKFAEIVLPIFRFFSKKCNRFAVVVSKKGVLQPWLKFNTDEYIFDMEYAREEYDPQENK